MLWAMGKELRSSLPNATFYRHRKQIKTLVGIDIATPCDPTHPRLIDFGLDALWNVGKHAPGLFQGELFDLADYREESGS
jgi:hypothetical protein